VVGRYGILPDDYASTDGLMFEVQLRPDGGAPRTLFERYLDPHDHPRDRGFQQLRIDLPPGAKGELVFRTFNLPGKHNSGDFSYWADIDIQADIK
jgi:hypothetical protein